MKLKCMIVVDDQPAYKALEKLCSNTEFLELVGVCKSAEEALEQIGQEEIDLLLLDIRMTGLSGADLMEILMPCRSRTEDVYVRQEGKYVRIDLDDILYFENVGDYVRIRTANTTYIIHSTLKSIGKKIHDPRFLRVHRSYIINLKKIKDIEENTLVIDKTVIPISRNNRPTLMMRINVL